MPPLFMSMMTGLGRVESEADPGKIVFYVPALYIASACAYDKNLIVMKTMAVLRMKSAKGCWQIANERLQRLRSFI